MRVARWSSSKFSRQERQARRGINLLGEQELNVCPQNRDISNTASFASLISALDSAR